MRRWRTFGLVLVWLALLGCRQEMADQPSYRPLEPSDFFLDGQAARPLVPGTIARGFLSADRAVLTGRPPGVDPDAYTPDSFIATIPVEVDMTLLKRGRERYDIFCAVCHDRLGTGHGRIVQRGFTEPPSFHTDLSRGFQLRGFDVPLREAPDGYFFFVITRGYGAMAEYRTQVPVADRWAIVSYIRALQKSFHPSEDDVRKLPAEGQEEVQKLRGGTP